MNNIDARQADRAVIVISDVEMSEGGARDDFPHTRFLSDFILGHNEQPYTRQEVDLVFNGDTFDFLKTCVDGEYHHLIDEDLALKKLAVMEQAHSEFFKAIKAFLSFRSKPRRVHFLVGNHDQELLFPKVQDRIISLCGNSGQVFFPGYEMRIGDMRIEHGSQKDDLFQVSPQKPFLFHNGKRILNLPWASVTLLNAFIPLHGELYELDRIKPKAKLFELLPELKEWMMSRLWSYWTKDYLREYVMFSDPLKKVSWNMIREAFKRSLFFNPDVSMGQRFFKELERNDDIKVQVVGHGHDPRIVSYGDRKLIEAGCFRDEFMLFDEGQRYSPIAKSYVEALFKDNKVLSSNLIEISGPELAPDRWPRPLEEYRGLIKERLAEEKKNGAPAKQKNEPIYDALTRAKLTLTGVEPR